MREPSIKEEKPPGEHSVTEEPPVPGEPAILAGLGYNGMPDGPGFQDFEREYFKPHKHKLGNIFSICIAHSLVSSHNYS